MLSGCLRSDGRKGIRNLVAVAYLVECAYHVAREIVAVERERAHLIGFPGCFPNAYAQRMMERLCTHPNVGAVLLVSLGCESFDRDVLARAVAESGRPVETLVIQQAGGTRATIEAGRNWVAARAVELAAPDTVPMAVHELCVGTVCGGSDGTSGITGNPAVGLAFDRLVAEHATCIFEETGELSVLTEVRRRAETGYQASDGGSMRWSRKASAGVRHPRHLRGVALRRSRIDARARSGSDSTSVSLGR